MIFPVPSLPLRDAHIPAASWWPPAPGWWVLAALVVVSLGIYEWVRRRIARRNAWRLRVLKEIDPAATQHLSDADFAASLHQLLRRVAWRYEDAALTQSGESWRRTLERVPVDTNIIQTLMRIEARLYRESHPFDRQGAQYAAREWVTVALRSVAESDEAKRHA